MRPRVAALLVGLGSPCIPVAVAAAELPDAVIDVTRAQGTESCPDDAELARTVLAQGQAAPPERGDGKVYVHVALTRDGEAYVATLGVDGRVHGERVLRGDGPTCDSLREALVLALLVLLDRVPVGESRTEVAEPRKTEPVLQLPPPVEPLEPAVVADEAPPTPPPPPLMLALTLGASLTFGEPVSVSGAVHGGAALLAGKWEIGLAGQWSPPRSVESGPGSVEVQAWGLESRLCRELWTLGTTQWSGCALGSLFVLSGEGQGLDDAQFRARPWWRAGLGAQAVVPLARNLQFAMFASGFATLHTESFSVAGLDGVQYETSVVTGELGAAVRIPLR